MADNENPFALPPVSKTPPIAVDWRWVEDPPARNEIVPANKRTPPVYDEIPVGTFRAACPGVANGGDGAGTVAEIVR